MEETVADSEEEEKVVGVGWVGEADSVVEEKVADWGEEERVVDWGVGMEEEKAGGWEVGVEVDQ